MDDAKDVHAEVIFFSLEKLVSLDVHVCVLEEFNSKVLWKSFKNFDQFLILQRHVSNQEDLNSSLQVSRKIQTLSYRPELTNRSDSLSFLFILVLSNRGETTNDE
jgi:hypothetical protein